MRRVIVLRVAFGVVWALDAYLKWQPDFIRQYGGDVASAGFWFLGFWGSAENE